MSRIPLWAKVALGTVLIVPFCCAPLGFVVVGVLERITPDDNRTYATVAEARRAWGDRVTIPEDATDIRSFYRYSSRAVILVAFTLPEDQFTAWIEAEAQRLGLREIAPVEIPDDEDLPAWATRVMFVAQRQFRSSSKPDQTTTLWISPAEGTCLYQHVSIR
jgi:hypothetical protein